MFETALCLANTLHLGQYRDNGVPYIIHPLQVVDKLNDWGFHRLENQELWCIAILHDVIEDCDISYFDLKAKFGEFVASGVQALSFRERKSGESQSEYMWAKTEYLANLGDGPSHLLVIKTADRYVNTKDRLKDREIDKAVKYWGYAKPMISSLLGRVDCQYARMIEDVSMLDFTITLLYNT